MTPGVSSDLPRYALQCQWAPLSGLDPDTLTFPGGEPIQLHTVPPGLLPRIALFYVCTRCGKVFWEGSHFGRVLSMFQDVFHITDTDSAAAPVPAAQHDWLKVELLHFLTLKKTSTIILCTFRSQISWNPYKSPHRYCFCFHNVWLFIFRLLICQSSFHMYKSFSGFKLVTFIWIDNSMNQRLFLLCHYFGWLYSLLYHSLSRGWYYQM